MTVQTLDLPQVAVASMNATHAEEVALLRDLLSALDADDAARAAELATAFAVHVEEHFAREERLMEQYGFPPYPIHKSEHDRMRPVVAELCAGADSAEGRAALARFIREEFLPWLSSHVATMDTATAHFLSMQGVE